MYTNIDNTPSKYSLTLKIQDTVITKNKLYKIHLYDVSGYDDSILTHRADLQGQVGRVNSIDYNNNTITFDISKNYRSNFLQVDFGRIYKIEEINE